MTEENESLGTVQHDNGNYTACLVRTVEHGKAAIWQMLVDPTKFINWLSPGSIDHVTGGAAKLDFGDSGIIIDSIVTDYENENPA
ncbi:MAG: hypothetical protein ACJAVI_002621 [Candidatus Azotimanducaceae bacterium]|jgi:hypothetical protein